MVYVCDNKLLVKATYYKSFLLDYSNYERAML